LAQIDCCEKSWRDLCTECSSHPVEHWKDHSHNSDPSDPVLGHHDVLPGGATCDDVVKEWHKWIFEIPASIHPNLWAPLNPYIQATSYRNPVDVSGSSVHMIAFPPFKLKQDNVLTLQISVDQEDELKKHYFLVPVITDEASTEEYPSLDTVSKLLDLIRKDTDSTQRLELCVDGISRVGCYVEQNTRFKIERVAHQNHMGIPQGRLKPLDSVEVVYNGFWALISAERLGPGDHLVTVEAEGKTYFNAATIHINILA